MPVYTYTAKISPSQTVRGDIEAESEQQAVEKLVAMGYCPLSISWQDLSNPRPGFFSRKKVSKREILQFSAQLSSLVSSGVNILNSLNIASNQIKNPYFKAVLSDVAAKIKDGKPISESMAGYPAVFSELYTSLLHTGEASGNISQALNSLAQYLEKEEQFRDSLSSALTYPVFIISVSVMTVVALVGFVIPRIARMFEDMQQALPLPTKILIGSSDFLRHWWWMIAVFLAATIFLFRRTYSNPRQRLQIDEFKLKVPIAGDIILKGQISRLMRALTLLISGGMTIGPSLDIGALTLNNEALKKLVIEFRQEINKGVRLSDVFKKSRYFPEASANIISVGEETGALEKSFSNIADEYEKELDQKVKTFLRLLEPSIILVMGLVVGFIVLSMILPIFQFNLIAG